MPALKKLRHEAFCQALFQAIAEGKTGNVQGEAWQSIHGNGSLNGASVSASRALARSGIAARLRELQAEAAARKAVTVDSIVDELEDARCIAREEKQASAMVAASQGKAKILGLQIERSEIGSPGEFNGSQSSREIAEALLKSVAKGDVTADMIEQAILELQRHCQAIEAIANTPTIFQ